MLHYTGAGKKAILEAVRRFTALEENASRSELGISKWNNAIANARPYRMADLLLLRWTIENIW